MVTPNVNRKKVGEKSPKRSAAIAARETEQPRPIVQMVRLVDIERDGDNHRLDLETAKQRVQELAESLNANGQQQPVQVFEYPADRPTPNGRRYLLAFGFRRCAAAAGFVGNVGPATQYCDIQCVPTGVVEPDQAGCGGSANVDDLEAAVIISDVCIRTGDGDVIGGGREWNMTNGGGGAGTGDVDHFKSGANADVGIIAC